MPLVSAAQFSAIAPAEVRTAARTVADWCASEAANLRAEARTMRDVGNHANAVRGATDDAVRALSSAADFTQPSYVTVERAASDLRAAIDAHPISTADPRVAGPVRGYEQALAGVREHLAAIDGEVAKAAPLREPLEARSAQIADIVETIPKRVVDDFNRTIGDSPAADAYYAYFPGGRSFLDEHEAMRAAAKQGWSLPAAVQRGAADQLGALRAASNQLTSTATGVADRASSAADDLATTAGGLGRLG
jgi:hypothetical protein